VLFNNSTNSVKTSAFLKLSGIFRFNMSMYSRSLTDRIRINLEIFYENCIGFLRHGALRKPLLIFAGFAAFVTLRNSRSTIRTLKSSYLSPFGSKWSSSNQFSPYGTKASSSPYGNTANAYNAGTYNSYGGSAPYGTNPASAYGAPNSPQTGTYANNMANGPSTSSYTNNLRGTAQSYSSSSSAAGFSTSKLVDQHGSTVQVVQGGLFHDYGMLTQFSGQIETISAMESPTYVQQSLSSPGSGKVLVVDGGGSFNGALFDAAMVNSALQNGWKGIIINGVVRNAEELKNQNFGIKALGAHPMKGQQMTGQRGMSLSFGGVNFQSGSWIYADKDGIVLSQTNLGVGGGMGQTNTGYGGSTSGGYPTGSGAVSSPYSAPIQTQYTSPGMNSYGAQQQNQPGGYNGSYQQSSSTTQYGATSPQYGATSPQYGRSSQYGGTSPQYGATSSQYGAASSQYGRSSIGGGLASRFGKGRSSYTSSYGKKNPSKKKIILLLLLVCLFAWFCLLD